jgi:hypothetical protein
MMLFMKANLKFVHFLVIAALVLFSLKPLLTAADNITPYSPQYSTTTQDCASRTPVVTSCQLLSYYTLTENDIQAAPYLFILAGSLFFLLLQVSSNPPKSRLFKPPIFFLR